MFWRQGSWAPHFSRSSRPSGHDPRGWNSRVAAVALWRALAHRSGIRGSVPRPARPGCHFLAVLLPSDSSWPLAAVAPFNVATVALGLNFSALMADILRAGYEAIPSGELKSPARSALAAGVILRHIILPQAFWRSLAPALGQAVNTSQPLHSPCFISAPEVVL